MSFKPDTKEELQNAVNIYCDDEYEGINIYGIIGEWNVSLITDMSELFSCSEYFNYDISQWDVSNVTNMMAMFMMCSKFNQPLNKWDISNVIDTQNMFDNCKNFNQPLNNWNVSNVIRMNFLFFKCTNFNQPLDKWNVSNVIDITCMFMECLNFNQPLNNWNVSNVTRMGSLFFKCKNFNQPLNKWDVSNVTDMRNMFYHCVNFNQNINDWDVSSASMMMFMFGYCISFNQPINKWNVSNSTNIDSMFTLCNKLDQSLIMWHKIPSINYLSNDYESILNDLIENPYTLEKRNAIIDNIMNTSLINNISNDKHKIIKVEYKNIFKGYVMPYKIVNYEILCILEHCGIDINKSINYNNFSNKLLVEMYLDKRFTLISNLIKHIRKTDTTRYNCLSKSLYTLYALKTGKDFNIIIYNDNIMISEN